VIENVPTSDVCFHVPALVSGGALWHELNKNEAIKRENNKRIL